MENSPPGIHTIPSGADPGGPAALATVDRNTGAVATAAGGDVFSRSANTIATALAARMTPTVASARRRPGGDGRER
jgi:hypothetical protein